MFYGYSQGFIPPWNKIHQSYHFPHSVDPCLLRWELQNHGSFTHLISNICQWLMWFQQSSFTKIWFCFSLKTHEENLWVDILFEERIHHDRAVGARSPKVALVAPQQRRDPVTPAPRNQEMMMALAMVGGGYPPNNFTKSTPGALNKVNMKLQ